MNHTYRIARLAAVAALSAVLVGACSGGGSPSGSSTGGNGTNAAAPGTLPNCGDEQATFITSTAGFLFMPVFVAESAGFYEKVRLKTEHVTIPGTQASLSALISGDADFSFTSAQAVITAMNKGAPLVMVGGINRQFASNIVVRRDIVDAFLQSKGVTDLSEVPPAERVPMLKGLRVGITEPGAGSDQLVRYLLHQAGLNPDSDARITAMGSSSAILSAFATQRVDAFSLSSPTDTAAVAQHDGVLVLNLAKGEYGPLNPFFYESIVTSKRFAESNPQIVECVVTAIAMAEKLLAEAPEQAATAARNNSVFESLEDAIYDQSFQTNLGSWYPTPVVEEGDVQKVFDFVTSTGEENDQTFGDVIDNKFANAAANAVQSIDVTP